jgi:hypothetical protein
MISPGVAVVLSLGLFLGMLICLEIGFRIGHRQGEENGEHYDEGSGVIEAAIFGLLGLLLAFSFAGGEQRLDERRNLIVAEANAIGSAYLRLDLLPDREQPEMRRLFRDYLDARLQVYEDLADYKASARAVGRVSQIQHEIWGRAVAASRLDASQNIGRLLLPALNEMIDITTSREIALHTHLPVLIFVLLICMALLSGVLAGYAMTRGKRRSWLHGLIFAAVISVTIYAVLDLDSPRSGLIRLEAADSALQKLRSLIQ